MEQEQPFNSMLPEDRYFLWHAILEIASNPNGLLYYRQIKRTFDSEKMEKLNLTQDDVDTKMRSMWATMFPTDDDYELIIVAQLKEAELRVLYHEFGRFSGGHEAIKMAMVFHFREKLRQMLEEPAKDPSKDPVEYVQNFLTLLDVKKDRYDDLIDRVLGKNQGFLRALDIAFADAINLNARSPEYISLFVDDKMRKGLEGLSSINDIEAMLDKVMVLFRHLRAKDTFEKYYRKHLAKRIISGKTRRGSFVVYHSEKKLIEKLGSGMDTSNLQYMLTDIDTSHDMMQNFYSRHRDGPKLAVQLFRETSWPIQLSMPCILPSEVSALCEEFSLELNTSTMKKKLSNWLTNLGNADIKATFGKGQEHKLEASTHQMCVLMLFNTAQHLTYKQISQGTEIPARALKSCLQSMACVKGKNVLCKQPMSEDIGEEDTFSVNEEFSNDSYIVNLRTDMELEQELEEGTKQVQVQVQAGVDECHKYQIDAGIVRIMKFHKKLLHVQLINEVTNQLQRFLPNPDAINKRIESLINMKYMKRDAEDSNLFLYIP